MFGRPIKLFTLAGISIGVDASWFIIAILVAWSLAAGLFPFSYPGLSVQTYWIMGIVGALSLFAGIVLHELAHAKTAQRYGLEMRGITLFIFGGVAEMQEEPPTPGAEFAVAIAGPIASVAIGLFCGLLARVGDTMLWSVPVLGVLSYLAWINILLAVFNLVPAFPLDGGRVLRAALWKWSNDLRRATRITASIGSGFGILLIVIGVFSFLRGNLVGGVWWFILGLFLRNAAQMSYRQLLLREILHGEPLLRFMNDHPDTVQRDESIEQLVENHVYRQHHKMFPVVENGHVLGCVTTRQVKEVPRDEWPVRTVGEVMEACSPENTASPADDAMNTLTRMSRTGRSRLLVVEDDRLRGIISLKDLTRFISLKLDFEEQAA